MELYHKGRKYLIYTREKIPEKVGQYVYFIRIGKAEDRLYKIGTANNIKRRMLEHCAYYGKEIYVLWISPNYSKYTTLRVEDNNKEIWKKLTDFKYLKNDRFVINKSIEKVEIKVRKTYEVILE